MSHNCQTLKQVKGIHKLVIPTPFSVGDVNAYLVEGEKLTLVDAGPKTEEAWQALNEQIQQSGFSIEDIEQIVLTHHHVDHYGLVERIMEKKAMPVLGHPLALPWVTRDPQFLEWSKEFFYSFYQQMGVPHEILVYAETFLDHVNRFSCQITLSAFLTEGMAIPGLSGWRVYETPGHASSHISLYKEQDGVFIAGDHIIEHISSNAIIEPPSDKDSERPKPLLQYRQSLQKCMKLQPSLVFSGHGNEVVDVIPLIEERLIKQKERAEKIRSWLAVEPLTAFDICQRMFPAVYKKQLVLTMSEVIGHLDLLEDQGKAYREEKGLCVWYKAR